MSAAKTTSPIWWLRITTPVVFEPGSIFKRKYGITGLSISRLRMIVKRKRRRTAALPFLSKSLARAVESGTGKHPGVPIVILWTGRVAPCSLSEAGFGSAVPALGEHLSAYPALRFDFLLLNEPWWSST